MRLDNERESENIEDRRGEESGGGFGGFNLGGGHLGIGGILIAFAASWYLGIDPSTVLNLLSGSAPANVQTAPVARPVANDSMTKFVSVVLAETEDTWTAIFKENGRTYRNPKLVLFTGSTRTACGLGESASGPFYCPSDEKLYIDLQFYQLLRDRYQAPGDFAQAYVIAHEVGHHVQNQLGLMEKVHQAQSRLSQAEYNALSVRLELQADCFAGVWANHADHSRHILEQGDIEEALGAAAAVGDDRLQMQAKGHVVPESFTHGSSEQRMAWFKRGLESGVIGQCNTFVARK